MKISNQSFPHPVLGLQDDVNGKFEADLTWSCDRAFYYLFPVFNLQNETIEELIENDLATFIVHIECGNTFFRKSFQFKDRTPEIKINAAELRDKVEVSFYITSIKSFPDYFNDKEYKKFN